LDADGELEDLDLMVEDEALERSALFDSDFGMNGSSALAAMTQLSKVCNHPVLLLPKHADSSLSPLQVNITNKLLPAGFDESQGPDATRKECEMSDHSGKLLVLDLLLTATKSSTSDKFVVVSSFTKTLDLIGHLAEQKGWKFVRLDGSVDISHRNHAVEQFQRDPSVFLFLLSTKAGGVGLNLFAANRLVLFDSSWNPAFDAQAQARVWRDGQKKPTWIYRFLTTGMLDEKIFQRQLVKNEMGRTVLDDAMGGEDDNASESVSHSKEKQKPRSDGLGVSNFSMEDLKDIFSVNLRTLCDTHDMSGCDCTSSAKSGKTLVKKSSDKLSQHEISGYQHHRAASSFPDPILASVASKQITFMFSRSTRPNDE
jgi:DNA repair and recombination RAD54-like protein